MAASPPRFRLPHPDWPTGPQPHTHTQPHALADGLALADGPRREALRQAVLMLDLAEAASGQTQPALLCHAHKGMAVALSRMQAYSPAQSHLAQALRWATVMGGIDQCADLNCALAEVSASAVEQALAHGAPADSLRHARERCRDLAFEGARLACRTSDPQVEMHLLLRASDVLDRCGDHDDAAQLQQRALHLMGLHADTAGLSASADDDTPPAFTRPADLDLPTLPSGLM